MPRFCFRVGCIFHLHGHLAAFLDKTPVIMGGGAAFSPHAEDLGCVPGWMPPGRADSDAYPGAWAPPSSGRQVLALPRELLLLWNGCPIFTNFLFVCPSPYTFLFRDSQKTIGSHSLLPIHCLFPFCLGMCHRHLSKFFHCTPGLQAGKPSLHAGSDMLWDISSLLGYRAHYPQAS